jgi:hypothetical protein
VAARHPPLMRRMPLCLNKRLRQRRCGERRICLHQTMSCRTRSPANIGVEEGNVEKIYPAEARVVSGTLKVQMSS